MRSRLISMFLTGLAIAVALMVIVQITQSVRNNFFDDETGSEEDSRPQTVRPILIDSVSESANSLSIRGVSHPNVMVSFQNSGETLAEIQASDSGEWAVDLPIAETDRLQIRILEYVTEDTPVLADETVFRIPPPVLDDASIDREPQALIFVAVPGKPSSIFQSPFRGLPTSGGVSMGSIDYDESGGVIFSGTSENSGRIRVFANNMAIGEQAVDANGRWYFIAPDTLPTGQFDIGAAHITENGILSQIKVPFERLTLANGVPENTLEVFYFPYSWQIRRQLVGGGYQYTAVFAPYDAPPIIEE